MSLLKWSHFVVISIIKASLNFVNSPVLQNLPDLLDLLNLSDFKDLLEHLDIYLFRLLKPFSLLWDPWDLWGSSWDLMHFVTVILTINWIIHLMIFVGDLFLYRFRSNVASLDGGTSSSNNNFDSRFLIFWYIDFFTYLWEFPTGAGNIRSAVWARCPACQTRGRLRPLRRRSPWTWT